MELGLGCWGLGSHGYGEISESEAKAIIHSAVDEGVDFFDTAPIYGSGLSEIRLGRYLPNISTFRIATKVGITKESGRTIIKNLSPREIELSVTDSLRRLNRESIFLLQIHSPESNFENEDIIQTLINLKASGKVANIGISLKNPGMFKEQHLIFSWDSFQYNCSILDQRISIHRNIINDYLSSNQTLLIARTPLNFGFLASVPPDLDNLPKNHHLLNWPDCQLKSWMAKRQEVIHLLAPHNINLLSAAIRFPLDSGLSNMVIPGVTSKHQFLENVSAFRSQLPSNVLNSLIKVATDERAPQSPYTIESF